MTFRNVSHTAQETISTELLKAGETQSKPLYRLNVSNMASHDKRQYQSNMASNDTENMSTLRQLSVRMQNVM